MTRTAVTGLPWRIDEGLGCIVGEGGAPIGGRLDLEFVVNRCNIDLAASQEEIARLRGALERIIAIENKDFGSDWEEIEEARAVASEALK